MPYLEPVVSLAELVPLLERLVLLFEREVLLFERFVLLELVPLEVRFVLFELVVVYELPLLLVPLLLEFCRFEDCLSIKFTPFENYYLRPKGKYTNIFGAD